MSSSMKTVVVAGAQGVIGRNVAEYYAGQEGWRVVGLSRREPYGDEHFEHVRVDLLNSGETAEKLRRYGGATHLVFAAYIERPTAQELVAPNVAMLRNFLDAFDTSGSALEHITFYQGGKAYGAHLGPFKTPGREDDPRHMPPNFYYNQEDFLRERQKNNRWTWTALRPEAVCGFALGNPMNLSMVIAVYAVISKALGQPLRFPGTEEAYDALYQVTSADILARATYWAGQSPQAANEIFNITNGDYFRWRHLWPRFARYFDMETADPLPISLTTYMADKGSLWEQIVKQHALQPLPYESVASWPFGDAILHTEYDNITSTIKARRAGFADCIDTEDMFTGLFDELRERRIIPA
jgi:nucleoside-diphosphate-sugar epimerase